MELEVLGIDHIFLAVSDLARSQAWYDAVMKVLGFRKVERAIGGAPHIHYFNQSLRLSIRPASELRAHDQNAPGLHHLCFQVRDRPSVDEAAHRLRAVGIATSAPRSYPEYAPDYYAIFLRDPDGIELEIVNRFQARVDVLKNWNSYRSIGE